jgi:hypothetical protein
MSLEPRKPRRGLRLVTAWGVGQGTTGVWHRAEGGVTDRGVVLMMPPKENSTRCAEGRPRPEGNPDRKAEVRAQGRVALPANLARVNEAARRGRQTRFTALLHHIGMAALKRPFQRQRKNASAGIDGVTVKDYEANLEKISKISVIGCTRRGTGPSRCGGPISPKRTVASGPWGADSGGQDRPKCRGRDAECYL